MEWVIFLLLLMGYFCFINLIVRAVLEVIEHVFRLLTAPRRCDFHFHYYENSFDDAELDFDDELDDWVPLEPKTKQIANRPFGK